MTTYTPTTLKWKSHSGTGSCFWKIFDSESGSGSERKTQNPAGVDSSTRDPVPSLVVSVKKIGDFCNPHPVQNFHWVIRSDLNPVNLSKYFVQAGLYPKKLWQFGYPYLIRLSFFEIQSDPVLNCKIRSGNRIMLNTGSGVRQPDFGVHSGQIRIFWIWIWIGLDRASEATGPDYPIEVNCGRAKRTLCGLIVASRKITMFQNHISLNLIFLFLSAKCNVTAYRTLGILFVRLRTSQFSGNMYFGIVCVKMSMILLLHYEEAHRFSEETCLYFASLYLLVEVDHSKMLVLNMFYSR